MTVCLLLLARAGVIEMSRIGTPDHQMHARYYMTENEYGVNNDGDFTVINYGGTASATSSPVGERSAGSTRPSKA